ncbi:hypothetical protein ColLi_07169 [Colletotrichum liriopes]|uniref:Uncharacterized protein n=1 Tax=Colletotrichum liriopes TaxID=708192 RepID=A0AA37GNK1_9PEZI|nr:hypothetical protein ColLi_07169 [Colletotrichum liriopes]
MTALLAVAQAATIPEASKVVTIPDSVLDAAINEPLVNYVPGPIAGTNPSSLLPSSEDPESQSLSSPEEISLSGAQAWAAIELEAAAALGSSPEDAERLSETRARDISEIAKGPGGGFNRDRTSRPAPPNFHRGVTKEQLCTYFRGIAWKTGDLQRPVYQWQYEYVPWLIHNKGPYIFSGYERQVTRLPTGAPAPVSPTTTAAANPTSTGSVEMAKAAEKPPGTGKSPVTTLPGSDRWFRPFPSLKKLLRIITAKAPVSRYQSYANHRIHNVLQNLDRSAIGAAKALIDKFQSNPAKNFLIYDVKEGQGLKKTLSDAINAYEVK